MQLVCMMWEPQHGDGCRKELGKCREFHGTWGEVAVVVI